MGRREKGKERNGCVAILRTIIRKNYLELYQRRDAPDIEYIGIDRLTVERAIWLDARQ